MSVSIRRNMDDKGMSGEMPHFRSVTPVISNGIRVAEYL